jgi:iron complex transport system substrate-binding protein
MTAGCRLVVLLLTAVVATRAAAAEGPRRVVSLNLCSDQLLIELLPRERIAGVSHLAADPTVSAVAERAIGLPVTRGEAESVLALDPDLVLAGAFSTPATVYILERVGRRVVRVGPASELAGIRREVRRVARALGEPARGEEMLARLDADLAAAGGTTGEAKGRAPAAAVYQVNGISAGTGTLSDAVLGWAGLSNHATTLGLGPGGQVSLEAMLAHPPDLIVLTGPADEYRTVVAENLQHPALTELARRRASVIVPWRLWLCGTPHVGAAALQLAAARRRLLGGARP